MWDSRLNLVAIKDRHYWNNWQNLNIIYRLDSSNILKLTSWFSWLYYDLRGECLMVENKIFAGIGHHASILKGSELKKKLNIKTEKLTEGA